MIKQCELSEESFIPEVKRFIPDDAPPVPISLPSLQLLTLRKQNFESSDIDYWKSTVERTDTSRLVDAVILPVAPTAAVITYKYMYYGNTDVAKLIDYTCVGFPVTKTDKDLNLFKHEYEQLNKLN